MMAKEDDMPNRMMRWFTYEHLPEELQPVSKACADLASAMDEIPEGVEKSAGMRKLLEAKDCFVRAKLEGEELGHDGGDWGELYRSLEQAGNMQSMTPEYITMVCADIVSVALDGETNIDIGLALTRLQLKNGTQKHNTVYVRWMLAEQFGADRVVEVALLRKWLEAQGV